MVPTNVSKYGDFFYLNCNSNIDNYNIAYIYVRLLLNLIVEH